MIDLNKIPSPSYVIEEDLLRKNLSLIQDVSKRSGAEIILAFKAFANWKAFPVIKEYINCSTASSVNEARLAFEEMKCYAHTYSPAYTEENFSEFLKYSSHITFNSITQFERFHKRVVDYTERKISCGLRINPEYSSVDTDLYNPCAPGSRMGISIENMPDELPEGIEGLHFHTLCESGSYDLEKTLEAVEHKFGKFLNKVKWLNMGGGHLMTREGYDIEHLVKLLVDFNKKYPNLKLIMEPGSAFLWNTGFLLSTIVDIVENKGISTAILDVSFACHMPDCLEMPYKPKILDASDYIKGKPTYRMGGNSCLSGDFIGDWSFEKPLKIGDKIVFLDMIHYTTVKTTMFNGIHHPSLFFASKDGNLLIWKEFGYEDYKNRMD